MNVPENRGTAAFFVFELITGVVLNVFFIAVIFIVDKKPSPGKKLLLFVHINELILIICGVFPFISHLARDVPLTTSECVLPSFLIHASSMLEPISIALMAFIRWKLVSSQIKTGSDTVVVESVNKWIGGSLLVLMLVLTVDLGYAYGIGLLPFWSTFYYCIHTGIVYLAGVCILFFAAAPFVIYYTLRITRFLQEHIQENKREGASRQQSTRPAIHLILAFTFSYYLSHVPWYCALFTNWFIRPVSIPVYRVLLCIYYLHASFTPLISIAVVPRYRKAALNLFKPVTSRLGKYGSKSNTTKSNTTSDVEKDAVVAPASDSSPRSV